MRSCPICCKISENLCNIIKLNLQLVDDITLNNNLEVKYCKECSFYFSDSNNTQEDYNKYYTSFNNYQQQNYCPDKDNRCCDFIKKNINNDKIKTIIDYGSGNGVLADLLSDNFWLINLILEWVKTTKNMIV